MIQKTIQFLQQKYSQIAALLFPIWGMIILSPLVFGFFSEFGGFFITFYIIGLLVCIYPVFLKNWKWYIKILALFGYFLLLFMILFGVYLYLAYQQNGNWH